MTKKLRTADSLQKLLSMATSDVSNARLEFPLAERKNDVDPVVEELLRSLLWLQEKTCGGVELGAFRGHIIARVEGCTMDFFKKMEVRKKFPEWVEFAFFYKNDTPDWGDIDRIEIHFGKGGLALKEYDLMMGWGKLGKED